MEIMDYSNQGHIGRKWSGWLNVSVNLEDLSLSHLRVALQHNDSCYNYSNNLSSQWQVSCPDERFKVQDVNVWKFQKQCMIIDIEYKHLQSRQCKQWKESESLFYCMSFWCCSAVCVHMIVADSYGGSSDSLWRILGGLIHSIYGSGEEAISQSGGA